MLGLTSRSRRRVRGMGAMQGFLPASDLGVRRMVSGTGAWREVAVRSELNLGPLA